MNLSHVITVESVALKVFDVNFLEKSFGKYITDITGMFPSERPQGTLFDTQTLTWRLHSFPANSLITCSITWRQNVYFTIAIALFCLKRPCPDPTPPLFDRPLWVSSPGPVLKAEYHSVFLPYAFVYYNIA